MQGFQDFDYGAGVDYNSLLEQLKSEDIMFVYEGVT